MADKPADGVTYKSHTDGADAERATLEARHARRLTRVLRSILRELLPPDISPDIAAHAVSRLQQYRKPLHDALYQMLLEGARLGTEHGRHAVEVLHGTAAKALDDDWDLVNEDARLWASQYAGQLVDGITATSTTLLQGALSDYIAGTITYRDLIAHLAPAFGSRRADTIATTEITAAFSAGTTAASKRGGLLWQRFNSARDERVCPICSPQDGTIYPVDDGGNIPAHVRCRCWWSPSADGPDASAA